MGGRILVIEQQRRPGLAAALTADIFQVTTTTLEGDLAVIEAARRERPDVILVDSTHLPPPLALCRALKSAADLCDTPLVIVSDDPVARRQVLNAGADDVLADPLHDPALASRLRGLVRLKRTADAVQLRDLPRETDETPHEPTRVLVVEDDAPVCLRLARGLEDEGRRVPTADDAFTALTVLSGGGIDLIVVSLGLAHDEAFHLVARLRGTSALRAVPILLICDHVGGGRLARGLDMGADDYVERPIDMDMLRARARLLIRRKKLREQLLASMSPAHNPRTDRLTGVYSRGYLADHLSRVETSHTALQAWSALMLAIDGLEAHAQGADGGDRILAEYARRIIANVRPFDLVARYTETVFVIIMPQTTGAIARQVAERLRKTLPYPIENGGGATGMTVSIGIACRDDREDAAPDLLRRAAQALDAALTAGGNRVVGPANDRSGP